MALFNGFSSSLRKAAICTDIFFMAVQFRGVGGVPLPGGREVKGLPLRKKIFLNFFYLHKKG